MITYVPYCNRAETRMVEKYMRKHPKLTFTQAYNALHGTDYAEPERPGESTATPIDMNAQIAP